MLQQTTVPSLSPPSAGRCWNTVMSSTSAHYVKEQILNNTKHGFRKILTVDDLTKELGKGGQTDTMLLDFAKAFNPVPHEYLHLKLHHLGIQGSTLQGIRNIFAAGLNKMWWNSDSQSCAMSLKEYPKVRSFV